MQKIYHITQTTKLLMNGSIIVENSVTQKWAVSFPIERHILIEVLDAPKQEENAEIFKLLTIINKPAYKVLFDFDNDDKIIICNKKEIGEAWEKSKDEVEKTFGSDDSIKNFLALSKEGYDSFENEMKDSLLYYTLWSWFGGGKSFTISPASSLFSTHKVSTKIKRIGKETLANGVLELTQQGEGLINDIDSIEEDIAIITVKNSRRELSRISRNFYDNPSEKLTVIGITGTKGKSTTTFMIKSILQASGKKVGLLRKYWWIYWRRKKT